VLVKAVEQVGARAAAQVAAAVDHLELQTLKRAALGRPAYIEIPGIGCDTACLAPAGGF
jgi:hypothetical protein